MVLETVMFFTQKNNKCTNVDIIYLQTICRNSGMVRSILIVFSESVNISKAYIKHRWIIQYIKICA